MIACFAAADGAALGDARPTFDGSPCLFHEIPFLNIAQCRVPPSPPAIRDMKKPRQRKFAGASDSEALLASTSAGSGSRRAGDLPASTPAQYFVMSTSFVSGRKKKPTTRLMHAITIGYQRPE